MTNKKTPADWRLATKLVRGGLKRSQFGETSEAIFMTSGFRYDAAEVAADRFAGAAEGFTYSRLSNPTVAMFEERMSILEGLPVAKATATGMAAVNAALTCQLRAGDKVVGARALFGSCRYILDEILPRYGITTELVNGADNDAWARAITPGTKTVFVETPANPTLDVVDLQVVCDLAHAVGATVVVDNVFATPLLQRPTEYGADVVVYSGTKHIDGQGRALGGVILCQQQFFDDHLNQYLRHTGPTMSPFNAWILLKGLETLDLRVTRMCENAAKVADFLADSGKLSRVLYPGRKDHPQHELAMRQMAAGGTVITMDVPGGRDGAFHLLNALEIIDISNNLGDAKSLMTHPASTTHRSLAEAARLELGIGEGTLRLSVGLEDADDLIEDLAEALTRI
ncbi:O-succinylhomoserine sulfhydrylase [Iodidimonas sp. SYSU 1G8]|uniref:O-succinylhomoserine sulfhydrylase n=1 Tax=Iodidimonas sp. SYSU 1G8 TaxID=3133967 RepID=UPI0031FF186F